MERAGNLDRLCLFLKRKKFDTTLDPAKMTKEILKQLLDYIDTAKWVDIKELFTTIRNKSKELIKAAPMQFWIANIVKRVLRVIREVAKEGKIKIIFEEKKLGIRQRESIQAEKLTEIVDELQNIISFEKDKEELIKLRKEHKADIMDQIMNLMSEIDNMRQVILEHAKEYILTNDVILTYDMSVTLVEFFKEAAKDRKFEVLVAETAPSFSGHLMAKKLSEAKIPTTVISDAAVFAMMPKINKVFLGSSAVLANGGIVNSTGAQMISIAAKAYFKPVIVISGMYKLCPLYYFDTTSYNELLSPMSIFIPRNEEAQENIEVCVPSLDYVSPEYISLYITDFGPQTPNYIYRMLADLYSQEDYNLEKE